jgi:hypothetical protein
MPGSFGISDFLTSLLEQDIANKRLQTNPGLDSVALSRFLLLFGLAAL